MREIPPLKTHQRTTAAKEAYKGLCQKWTSLFSKAPPRNLSGRLIAHAIAYEEQVRLHGGLSEKTKQRLRELAADSGTASQNTKLSPGTRLMREWNGRTYVVDVTEDGFTLDRKNFSSLSAVAGAITGSHWSGRAFFGLVKRRSKPTSRQETENDL